MRSSSIIAGIIISALIGVFAFAPWQETNIGLRDVTGTRLVKITRFGLFHYSTVIESPLAKWCAAHGIPVKETDRFYSTRTSGLLGVQACGREPAIGRFRDEYQEVYLRLEKEPAIKEFVAQMSAADDAAKEKLVEGVFKRMGVLGR
jgi:hypothetical protein